MTKIAWKTTLIIMCLALLCSLAFYSGTACAETEAKDPIVVRVGDFTYSQSMVQGSLDSMMELSGMLQGSMPGEEEIPVRLQNIVDSFVGLGIIENKLTEAGKNEFTDAEQEELARSARMKYEQTWQALYRQMQQQDPSVTEEAVTEQLTDMGYTQQAILDEYTLMARQNRAMEIYCSDVVLTESMVDAYYENQFLIPDREAYKDDLQRYESEILSTGNESFYTPEGYRYLRQIVLEIPKEALSEVKPELTRMNRAGKALASALQNLTLVITKTDGWTDELAAAKAEYDKEAAAVTSAQQAYADRLQAIALPMVQDTVDEIRSQYNTGIDFKTLVNKYSIDRTEKNLNGDGYPFHPDSPNWPENFKAAAARLEKPGDISDPVLTDQGIHIICYEGDIPSGDHVLTEDERQILNTSAMRYYRLEKLDELIEGWQADYEIETHPELLYY